MRLLPRRQTKAEIRPAPDRYAHVYLPWSVRFALEHQSAALRGEHINYLYKADGLSNLGFYLVMKAMEDHDGHQADLLQSAHASGYKYTHMTQEPIDRALATLAASEVPTVKGGKLAEVSRMGFGHWPTLMGRAVQTAMENEPESPVFIVANTTFIALGEIAAHTLAQNKPLGILKPSRLGQNELPVGFMLSPHDDGLRIDPLASDFIRPSTAIIMDDAIRNGTTRDHVLRMWQEYAPSQPTFIAPKMLTGAVV